MSNISILARLSCVLLPLAVVAGCATGDDAPAGDGSAPPAPLDPAGNYVLRSQYSMTSPPAAAAASLAQIAEATDGPDDPSRFLIDRMVARLPEGRTQVVAAAVAPYLAAYVQARIDRIAPELASGLRALGDGLGRVARRWGTIERLAIGDNGRALRLVTGLELDGVSMAFAAAGVGDIASVADASLDSDRITLGRHEVALPYGVILREGLDRAIIPKVVPGARSLDVALATLVDCASLGEVASEYVGLGSPELYAAACRLALTRLAAEVYERLDIGSVPMSVTGLARVVDLDGDGPVDVIMNGTWSGTIGNTPLATSTFDGATP